MHGWMDGCADDIGRLLGRFRIRAYGKAGFGLNCSEIVYEHPLTISAKPL